MRMILVALLASSAANPALAQHAGHTAPAPQTTAPPNQSPEEGSPAADPHAGHGPASTPPPTATDEPAGHTGHEGH